MRALFIQHDHTSPTGPIGEQFAARGYDIDEFLVVPEEKFPEPHVEVTFPDPLQYDVIIPMGAIWAVYDSHVIDWIGTELDLLRTSHDAGIPIFGICFGGQAVAAALGGAVEKAPIREVGWHVLSSDAPDLIDPGPWFEWHYDRWTAPPGARTIARTERADQAFVLGRSLGLQFHPEVQTSTLLGWLANGGYESLARHGTSADELIDMTERVNDDAARRARALVDRFLNQVAVAPVEARAMSGSPETS